MRLTKPTHLAVISILTTCVIARTATLHAEYQRNGASTPIPWSQCIPMIGNKSIEVPKSYTPDQVQFECDLYSAQSCQGDREKVLAGYTDTLSHYTKCVFVPASGYVSLFQEPDFEGNGISFHLTEMAPCQQVPSLWQTGNVSSIAVGEGYTCELYEADNCTSEPYSIQSPGESDLGLRTIKRISCAQAALEKSGSLDDIHYDL